LRGYFGNFGKQTKHIFDPDRIMTYENFDKTDCFVNNVISINKGIVNLPNTHVNNIECTRIGLLQLYYYAIILKFAHKFYNYYVVNKSL
jgi:hypothetical protein